jgi:predicted dehydrogenase
MSASTQTSTSANEAVRMAVVGVRGRGGDHIKEFSAVPGVEVTALCDVDERVLNQRAAECEKRTNKAVKKYVDIRALLENPDIDAISIATPNHWHSLQAIWACEAGKDVYVEKPCSHNIREGRLLVETARKYNRIVQHGTQSRSAPALREAVHNLNAGLIGEVYYAKGICYKWRDTIGRKPVEAAPEGVHYDAWLGPAPERPFTQNRFHYNWHWHWDYGNGDIGNQGVHQMDVARWGLGVGLPKLASSIGGHFMFDDDQETPNTLVTTFKYPDENKMLLFEVRHWITNDELKTGGRGNVIGNLFLGSDGYMLIKGSGYETYLGQKRTPGPRRNQDGDHAANFIKAVRSRKPADLNADILEGHLSSALCHLANASYLVQRTLHFDPAAERCVHDEEADAILQGEYRAPYVLPGE